MSKPRKCPHCGHVLSAHSEYTFDHELNIRCGECSKVVFPATPAAEIELLQRPDQTVFTKPVSGYYEDQS